MGGHIDQYLNQIQKYIYLLYSDIQIHQSNTELIQRPFVMRLNESYEFSLSENGYINYYSGLVGELLSFEHINKKWSSIGIKECLEETLMNIAQTKMIQQDNLGDAKASEISQNLINRLSIQFEDLEYFIPIHGLVIKNLLQIGNVKIWPIDHLISEFNFYEKDDFFNNLSPYKNAVASTLIAAEVNKSGEILRERVEKVLNILRYYSALIYWNRPTHHIYEDGKNPSVISNVLIRKEENFAVFKNSTNPYLLPMEIDDVFLKIADVSHNFRYINDALSSSDRSQIQSLILNSINWYGDATQDMNSYSSFMKYYTAIESLLKNQAEDAKSVLPKRASLILESVPVKRREIKKMVINIVNERNSIFHEGTTKELNPAYLSDLMFRISRNTIRKYIYFAEKKRLDTKDDFIAWMQSIINVDNSNIFLY